MQAASGQAVLRSCQVMVYRWLGVIIKKKRSLRRAGQFAAINLSMDLSSVMSIMIIVSGYQGLPQTSQGKRYRTLSHGNYL
jgi:hypothetical protein